MDDNDVVPHAKGGPTWLLTPGVAALPSGRRILVGRQDETWVTLELLGGVRVVIDLDAPGRALLALHRARDEADGAPGTRPHRAEATVAMDDPGGGLVIRDIPTPARPSTRELTGEGTASAESAPPEQGSQFLVTVPDDRVATYVDVLAGLPLDTRPWSVPVAGVRLWRGRIDSQGWAVVELLGDDAGRWHAEMPVVARVDLGLSPPA